jgi:hypothetical protein
MLPREIPHLVVVDARVLAPDAIAHRIEPLARQRDRGGVREVTAMRKRHPEQGSPGRSNARSTAALACEPKWGCTFTCSTEKSSFARSIASISTSSTTEHPP